MLAVSPLRSTNTDIVKDERERGEMDNFSIGENDFLDFSGGNLLDIIDFDLFEGMGIDGDMLPDLEVDPEMFMEFSSSGGEESVSPERIEGCVRKGEVEEEEDKVSGSGSFTGSGSGSSPNQGEEIASKREESNSSRKEGEKGRKSSGSSKNSQGKRKVKVDWTPELHRRFVQAVEQLGVDKAVPSRILELMGIDCLTRHNIASHLQKYRSHRKHLLAREAEAATWTHKRQMYGGGGGSKKNMNPWLAPVPTMGFPHPPPPPMAPMQHFRPLHVWGHPPHHDQSAMMHHRPVLPLPVPPPAAWGQTLHPSLPRPVPSDPSFWHSHHQRVPNSLTPGTPCFPPPMATTRFSAPPVPGIPPHAMFRSVDQTTRPTGPHPPSDFHPSKESIDEAIGDVLTKPWLPLPLGLKPPSMDSVMGELQRQGVPNIPPTCA